MWSTNPGQQDGDNPQKPSCSDGKPERQETQLPFEARASVSPCGGCRVCPVGDTCTGWSLAGLWGTVYDQVIWIQHPMGSVGCVLQGTLALGGASLDCEGLSMTK